jgi:hypothetical protein
MDENVALEELNYRRSVFSADMLFNFMYFPHQLHTHSVSYFAVNLPPPPPGHPKHFLFTDIISINKRFSVRYIYYDNTNKHTLKTKHKSNSNKWLNLTY